MSSVVFQNVTSCALVLTDACHGCHGFAELFNPEPEVESLLTTKGQGLFVVVEGRLSGSSPDANGARKFGTEVIVKNRSLTVLRPAAADR